MLVIPKANSGKALPPKYFSLGYTEQSEFNITIGKEYTVFAIGFWQSAIHFLICDDSELPNWHPAELFLISDGSLPNGWLFSTCVANEHGVDAVCGYERLIIDKAHYESLLERDPEAIHVFRQEQRARESGL
jgi:hypothetical protein